MSTKTKTMAGLTFDVMDLRGEHHFPADDRGIVYCHAATRQFQDPYTGLPRQRQEHFLIRTDSEGKGWRIDRLDFGLPEAVRVDDVEYWSSSDVAAEALAKHLI